MELRELRSFCVAARFSSISKAAAYLGIGQPTVTTHIKKLENELRMVLFDRVRRPIRLTASGKTLAEMATPLVEGLDALAARTAEAEELGPVVLGAQSDIVAHTLLQVVRVFFARYPHVHLRIRSGTRAEVLHMVAEGEVDLGVIPHPEGSEEFEFESLFLYERVAITPLDHELLKEPLTSLEQVARWPLFLMGRGTHTRTLLEDEFRRQGFKYDIVMELDSMYMIKRYVALGMGISVGLRLAIEPQDRHNLGVISLANLLPVDQGGIVTLRRKVLSTAMKNFVGVMRDVLAPTRSQG